MTVAMDEDTFSSATLSHPATLAAMLNSSSNRGSSLVDQTPPTSLYSSTSSLASTNGGGASSPTSVAAATGGGGSPPSSSASNNANIENCPYMIFYSRSQSGTAELYDERRILLDKACKIGRSVAKIKPEPTNAIFDCKVLSRNHAIIWYENGKFLIQDTKSSNGTFLNGNRLGKSNEDSLPYELNSTDIIQFGVDVTENTKKVTHGCITVEIKLFHRPGVEATSKINQQSPNKIDIQTQELYQLALYLQEAMMREELLHQKLISLQNLIEQAKGTSENGWLTLIDEDRLLTRIDYLEKQLALATKNASEDSLKACISTLMEEKQSIENESKLTTEKMVKEKHEMLKCIEELKIVLSTRDEECLKLKEVNEHTKKSLLELVVKYQELMTQADEMQRELADTKSKFADKTSEAESDKQRYEAKILELDDKEKNLSTQIESLLADKDFQNKRLEGLLSKLEQKNAAENAQVVTTNIKSEPSDELVTSYGAGGGEDEDSLLTKEMIKINENGNGGKKPIVVNGYGNNNDNHHISADEKQQLNGHLEHHHDDEQDIKNDDRLTAIYALRSELDEEKKQNHKLSEELTIAQNNIKKLKSQLDLELANLSQIKEENMQLKTMNKENNHVDYDSRIKHLINEINEKKSNLVKLDAEIAKKSEWIDTLGRANYDNYSNMLANNGELRQRVLNVLESSSSRAAPASSSSTLHDKLTSSVEFMQLKEDCIELKSRIQTIETEMRKFLNNKLDNYQLSEDYNYVQDSYKELQELKESLEMKESKIQLNLTDAQKQSRLENKTSSSPPSATAAAVSSSLDNVIEEMHLEYDNLSLRTKIVSYFSMIPLFLLVIAIMIAFYPALSAITATRI